MATGNHHPAADKLLLKRFETGNLLDEAGNGPTPNLH